MVSLYILHLAAIGGDTITEDVEEVEEPTKVIRTKADLVVAIAHCTYDSAYDTLEADCTSWRNPWLHLLRFIKDRTHTTAYEPFILVSRTSYSLLRYVQNSVTVTLGWKVM
jgi:hypothetical protein